MTVASTTRKAGPFSGNGTQTAFPFSFKVYTKNDISVTVTTSAGLSSTLVLDSDYSVAVNANQDTSPGGTVTYPITGNALISGSTLTITGSLAYSQTTQLPSGGAYNAQNVESAFDRLTILAQQLLEAVGRALALPVSVASGVSGTLPVPSSNKLIGWNESATALQNIDPTTLATIVAFGTANGDLFSGTGLQTVFTLSANPGAVNNLDISVGGVTQRPGVDYTWSGGTTLTFTTAPPAGTNNVFVRYFQGLPQGTTDSAASTFLQSGTSAQSRSVQSKLRETVSVTDFGADATGVSDSATSFQAAVNAGVEVVVPSGSYKIGTAISLPAGSVITGIGRPTLTAVTNGQHIFQASSVATVAVRGIKFVGTSSSTVPTVNVGGVGAASTGLVTLVSVTDVRIEDCEFSAFYNGVTAMRCTRAWIRDNRVTAFYLHGILASQTSYFQIDDNVITGCTQTGAVISYGIHATGDQAGGYTQQLCSISGNKINGVSSWDGIMSHDVNGLIVANNDIRDVRSGIDVGHFTATNVVKNITITGNYIESTSTNTWGATGANSFGIAVSGYNASNRVDGATIAGNVIRNFFTATGLTVAGVWSNIVVAQADNVTVTGNVVIGTGSVFSNAGIYVNGTVNRLTLTGNTMQGTMALGAIRINNVSSDGVTVFANLMLQTSTAVEGLLISGSTITALSLGGNASNSTLPWSQSTSTLTFSGTELENSAVYDPPNLAAAATTTTTITVTGATLGDFVVASFSNDLQGITITSYVSAANTVTVRFTNPTAGALDLASGTLRARVSRRYS